MKFLKLLIISLIGFFSFALSAQNNMNPTGINLDPNDFNIKQAFKDHDGNVIIRLNKNSNNQKALLTFWGPRRELVYHQLFETHFEGNEYEFKIHYLVSSDSRNEREGLLELNKEGRLTISFEGGKRVFLPLPDNKVKALEDEIKAGQIELREVHSSKQITQTPVSGNGKCSLYFNI